MTWPTTNIKTNNLDSGTGHPAKARSELKQAAENINSAAETVNPTQFVNGELIQFQDNSFIPFDISPTLETFHQTAVIELLNSSQTNTNFKPDGFNTKREIPNITFDFDNIITITNDSIELQAGEYHFYSPEIVTTTRDSKFYVAETANPSNSDLLFSTERQFVGERGGERYYLAAVFNFNYTVNTTQIISFWTDDFLSNLTPNIMIRKLN